MSKYEKTFIRIEKKMYLDSMMDADDESVSPWKKSKFVKRPKERPQFLERIVSNCERFEMLWNPLLKRFTGRGLTRQHQTNVPPINSNGEISKKQHIHQKTQRPHSKTGAISEPLHNGSTSLSRSFCNDKYGLAEVGGVDQKGVGRREKRVRFSPHWRIPDIILSKTATLI